MWAQCWSGLGGFLCWLSAGRGWQAFYAGPVQVGAGKRSMLAQCGSGLASAVCWPSAGRGLASVICLPSAGRGWQAFYVGSVRVRGWGLSMLAQCGPEAGKLSILAQCGSGLASVICLPSADRELAFYVGSGLGAFYAGPVRAGGWQAFYTGPVRIGGWQALYVYLVRIGSWQAFYVGSGAGGFLCWPSAGRRLCGSGAGGLSMLTQCGSGAGKLSMLAQCVSGAGKLSILVQCESGAGKRSMFAQCGSGAGKLSILAQCGSGAGKRSMLAPIVGDIRDRRLDIPSKCVFLFIEPPLTLICSLHPRCKSIINTSQTSLRRVRIKIISNITELASRPPLRMPANRINYSSFTLLDLAVQPNFVCTFSSDLGNVPAPRLAFVAMKPPVTALNCT
ncbi:hypothetical protein EVAR_52473_1 [Eumeta japonica]|uniref:Uncharacterized protein n=1 Tax=Eumeta variegata TaxID=151549 RepID=A0A4C1Z3G1_EUMVA|nr:hypothetical protein EVAR_52473_1 [Eumeta japonica]